MGFTERCFWRKNSTKRFWYPGTLPPDPSCYGIHFETTYSKLQFQVLDKTKVDLKLWISPCLSDYLISHIDKAIVFAPPLPKFSSSWILQDCNYACICNMHFNVLIQYFYFKLFFYLPLYIYNGNKVKKIWFLAFHWSWVILVRLIRNCLSRQKL